MISTFPKFLLALFGLAVVAILLDGASGSAGSLKVGYENNFLRIQNVGDKPILIQSVIINDRPDCKIANASIQGNNLQIGESLLLISICDAVRVTINTGDGSEEYDLSR